MKKYLLLCAVSVLLLGATTGCRSRASDLRYAQQIEGVERKINKLLIQKSTLELEDLKMDIERYRFLQEHPLGEFHPNLDRALMLGYVKADISRSRAEGREILLAASGFDVRKLGDRNEKTLIKILSETYSRLFPASSYYDSPISEDFPRGGLQGYRKRFAEELKELEKLQDEEDSTRKDSGKVDIPNSEEPEQP